MGVEAVIATQVIDTTSVGRSLMTAADAAAVRTAISFDESVDDRVSALLVAGTNITITYNDAANTLTIASTASGLSGTGSVDNAALRADGTNGATLQSSAWIINDNLTASPNNTVNHACLEATGGTANVSVSIKPKGTGAFCLAAPDGTTTGGNARGANAVDLCSTRATASAVASGDRSVVLGAGTASGQNSIAIQGGIASGLGSVAIQGGIASGLGSVIFGAGTSAGTSSFVAAMVSGSVTGTQAVAFSRDGGVQSGVRSFSHGEVPGYGSGNVTGRNAVGFSGAEATAETTFASGYYASASRYGMLARASGAFVTFGDAQSAEFVARNKTTSNTPVNLFLNGSSTRLTVPSGKTMSGLLIVKGIKSDGTTGARFVRLCDITNVGGTTAMDVSAEAIGTDWNPQGCTLAVTGENATDDLQMNITAPNGETWRWVSRFIGLEIAYGT